MRLVAKRKKKKVEPKGDPPIMEYEGRSLGDEVWFCISYEVTPHQGRITGFHPDDSIAPAVSLYDISHGGHRVAAVQYIFNTKKEAKEARAEYLEFLKTRSAEL